MKLNQLKPAIKQCAIALGLGLALNATTTLAQGPDELRQDSRWIEVSHNVFKAELPNGQVMTHGFGAEGMQAALDDLTAQRADTAKSASSEKNLADLDAHIADVRMQLQQARIDTEKASQLDTRYTCGVYWRLNSHSGMQNFAYFGVDTLAAYYPISPAGGNGWVTSSTYAQINSNGQSYTDYDFHFLNGAPTTSYTIQAGVSVPTWSGTWNTSASLSYKTSGCTRFEYMSHSGSI